MNTIICEQPPCLGMPLPPFIVHAIAQYSFPPDHPLMHYYHAVLVLVMAISCKGKGQRICFGGVSDGSRGVE